jgi:hypothetical protein
VREKKKGSIIWYKPEREVNEARRGWHVRRKGRYLKIRGLH